MNNNLHSLQQNIIRDHPQFTGASFTVNQEGWDNLVLIADGHTIFRIPRNEVSQQQLRLEIHLLPEIGRRCKLAVPEYICFSSQANQYVGYKHIPGEPFSIDKLLACDDIQQEQAARDVGDFLSCLHTLPYQEWVTDDLPLPRQNMAYWLKLHDKVLAKANQVLSTTDCFLIQHLFDEFLNDAAFETLPQVLIHGDFSSDHLLFDDSTARISGVIDFGDMMLGDAAYDLTGLYLCYGVGFTRRVLTHYHAVLDDRFMQRINQFYLKKVPLHSLLHGLHTHDTALVQNSLRTFRKLCNG